MEKHPPAVQPSLFLTTNQGLFSNNYIEKHLPTSPAWTQLDARLATIFAGVNEQLFETLFGATRRLTQGNIGLN